MNGDRLMQRLFEAVDAEERGRLANEILSEFFRGYPVENLRAALHHSDPEIQKSGIWIASELGVRGRPILADVVSLLSHELRWIRYFVLDCVVTCAGGSDGELIVRAAALLQDPDDAVRARATEMLAQLSTEQLDATRAYLSTASSVDPELTSGFSVLRDDDIGRSRELVSDGSSSVLRKFGLALAMRRKDQALLQEATLSRDAEVQALAQQTLDRVR